MAAPSQERSRTRGHSARMRFAENHHENGEARENQRSPIITIGDISPTERRAAMVWPAHISVANVSMTCGLFQRRIKTG